MILELFSKAKKKKGTSLQIVREEKALTISILSYFLHFFTHFQELFLKKILKNQLKVLQ